MFVSVNFHHQDVSFLILSSKHKYVHLKTHWAAHTMHQNLAVILCLFNYSKNRFIVLIPGGHRRFQLPDGETRAASHFPRFWRLERGRNFGGKFESVRADADLQFGPSMQFCFEILSLRLSALLHHCEHLECLKYGDL